MERYAGQFNIQRKGGKKIPKVTSYIGLKFQMTALRKFLPIIIPVFLIFGSGCNNKKEKKTMSNLNDRVEVRVNEPGADFQKRYAQLVRIDSQPVGVSFFKIDWTPKSKGHVKIDSGKHSFEIDDVLGFVGTENDTLKAEGMLQLNIISGISGPNGVSHEDARNRLFSILTRLKKSGWQTTIPFSAPRLSGKNMLDYLLSSNASTTLDATYQPSMDEWMKLPDLATWELYADHIFLEISFVRDTSQMDVTKPSSYLINYKLQSEVNYFKAFVDPLQREKWKALLPAELAIAAGRRRSIEDELTAKGVPIAEEYRDPPIPK